MSVALYKSPIGIIKIEENQGKVTSISMERRENRQKKANPEHPSELTDRVSKQLEEYFQGKRSQFDFPCCPEGTAFQKKVWQTLLEIPYGETRSYKDIAAAIGQPKACRAVGMANNKNPIALAIPCHRVIGSKGELTGYAGGLEIKKQLLDMEKTYSKKRKKEDTH